MNVEHTQTLNADEILYSGLKEILILQPFFSLISLSRQPSREC